MLLACWPDGCDTGGGTEPLQFWGGRRTGLTRWTAGIGGQHNRRVGGTATRDGDRPLPVAVRGNPQRTVRGPPGRSHGNLSRRFRHQVHAAVTDILRGTGDGDSSAPSGKRDASDRQPRARVNGAASASGSARATGTDNRPGDAPGDPNHGHHDADHKRMAKSSLACGPSPIAPHRKKSIAGSRRREKSSESSDGAK